MPTCPRCGKNLCNKQSLENHMQSTNCRPCQPPLTQNSFTNSYYSLKTDLKGKLIEVSDAVLKAWNYNYDDLINRCGYDFIYEKDKFYVCQLHIESLINNVPASHIFRRIGGNGNIFPVQASWTISKDQNELSICETILNFHKESSINYLLNSDLSFCYVSNVFKDKYGYSLQDLENVKWYDIWYDVCNERTNCGINTTHNSISFISEINSIC